MRPFINFFGGKWSMARRLGVPQRGHVIEPFAGSAGYSTYWQPSQVTLIERDPVIFGLWDYLRRASPREIMALPVDINSVDELHACQEAKWLVGFWLNRGLAQPAKRRSNWARSDKYRFAFWGQHIRQRIASQVEHIRHWKIIEGDWWEAPDIEAHWHIDPPYVEAGRCYRFNNINRKTLAEWCKERRGFVQVCEADGADWLPFTSFTIGNTPRVGRFSAEALFEQENVPPEPIVRRTVHASLRRRRA
jgi:hypothetical protein